MKDLLAGAAADKNERQAQAEAVGSQANERDVAEVEEEDKSGRANKSHTRSTRADQTIFYIILWIEQKPANVTIGRKTGCDLKPERGREKESEKAKHEKVLEYSQFAAASARENQQGERNE